MVPCNVFNQACMNMRLAQPADSAVIKTDAVQVIAAHRNVRNGVSQNGCCVAYRNSPDAEETKDMVKAVSAVVLLCILKAVNPP